MMANMSVMFFEYDTCTGDVGEDAENPVVDAGGQFDNDDHDVDGCDDGNTLM